MKKRNYLIVMLSLTLVFGTLLPFIVSARDLIRDVAVESFEHFGCCNDTSLTVFRIYAKDDDCFYSQLNTLRASASMEIALCTSDIQYDGIDPFGSFPWTDCTNVFGHDWQVTREATSEVHRIDVVTRVHRNCFIEHTVFRSCGRTRCNQFSSIVTTTPLPTWCN